MLLTIDVGNTQTVYGLFEGEEIVDHWRVATDPRRTSDELSVMTQGLLNQHPTSVVHGTCEIKAPVLERLEHTDHRPTLSVAKA